MSGEVVLSSRGAIAGVLDAECIAPNRFSDLASREIARLPVWLGRQSAALGEFFDVRGERATRIRVEADDATLARVSGIGAGMDGGELVIEGSVGNRAGAGMRAGRIVVRGSAGDDAGVGMAGGVLRIEGDAGARVGGATPGASRGMTGGEILVLGRVGADAGARARRGLIVVRGDAGPGAGHAMIAGTVLVFGSAAPGAGQWSKRGTVVVMGDVTVPATFRLACTYRPPHLALTLAHLSRAHAIDVDPRQRDGVYRRYSGDLAELGKGEILHWSER